MHDILLQSGFTPRSVDTLAATLVHVPEMEQVSFLTAVLMAVALCFHSILEVPPLSLSEPRLSHCKSPEPRQPILAHHGWWPLLLCCMPE